MRHKDHGFTARSIALRLIMLSNDPLQSKWVSPEVIAMTKQLIQTTTGGQQLLSLTKQPIYRRYYHWMEKKLLPGFSTHVALRKQWMEKQTIQAIQAGITQVIILGAGLDTMATRLHKKYSEVIWIELDHPNTQQYKKKFFDKNKKGENLHLYPIDFSKNHFFDWLATTDKYQRNQSALFIAEGLLMYLQPHEVRHLFESIRTHCETESLFIGTALQANPPIYQKRTKFNHWQAQWMGTPYLWKIPMEQLPTFLKKSSFQLIQLLYSEKCISSAETMHPLPKDEYLFLAKFPL